ncbi:MAG: hypothetical protein H5T62_16990 [Anaerolineae bacterium]|nr:hypothetical protein [Anaerolineae bacterium]
MKRVSVELWRFTAVCINGHEFCFHRFSDFHYGDLTIRTANQSELALVETDDPVFNEVGSIIDELLVAAWGNKNRSDWCFDQVFPIVCDPAPSGLRYSFAEEVRCPVCNSTHLVRYGPGEPPQVDTVELPVVTYNAWQQLSYEEKRGRLRDALRKAGCLP